MKHLFPPSKHYQYRSEGILKDGEPIQLFENWEDTEISHSSAWHELKQSLALRKHVDYLETFEYRGQMFNIQVAGGSRTYYLERTDEVSRLICSSSDLI